MTRLKKAYTEERLKDKTASNAEIARRAGYSPKVAKQVGWKNERSADVQNRILELGEVGLDTLEQIARDGKVEIARVQAGKTLIETAYGKPKDNPSQKFGDITINVHKLNEVPKNVLPDMTVTSVK